MASEGKKKREKKRKEKKRNGPASQGGPASEAGPAEAGPVSEAGPASEHGPEAEFRITRRMSLLKTLKDVLHLDVPPTVWACLWLSDIDRLEELVTEAKRNPVSINALFLLIESGAKIVQKCGFPDFNVFSKCRFC
jgi:hypothetical protein